MKAVIILGFVAACAQASLETQFAEWKTIFARSYTGAEHEARLANFRKNAAQIAELNAGEAHRPNGATFKLNKYADWSAAELQRLRGIKGAKAEWRNGTKVGTVPKVQAPASVDWRQRNVLSPVQDQGQCGSCWAFSATATLESQAAISGGTRPKKLAEQWLVDCDKQCGTYRSESGCDAGCEGGLQPNAWVYTTANGGQPAETDYPYTGADGTCMTGLTGITTPKSWEFAPSDEPSIATYVAANGPVSIAVDASNWSFYTGGIMSGSSVCPTSSDPWSTLDHGVNIVGYGTDSGTDFWIIRNSWNADWGEQGYCRIVRGSNFCGVNLFACRATF